MATLALAGIQLVTVYAATVTGLFVAIAVLSFALSFASSYIRGWRSPLNALPGPPPTSFLLGNFGVANEHEGTRMLEKWVLEYGRAYVVRSLLGVRILKFALHSR